MSSDSFDPDVVALLREVAADPRASLLRIPKERLLRWVKQPEEVVKPSGSHLTKAEKHLVSAYREEAAWVLLQACVAELRKLPLVFPTMESNKRRLKEVAGRLSKTESLPVDTRAVASRVAADMPIGIVQNAAAALRLAPCSHARNVLATGFEREGRLATSERLLRVLLAGESSKRQRAQACENLARVWTRRGDHSKALVWSSRAAAVDEGTVRFLVWCLASALQAGDEPSAREHAKRIDEHSCRDEVAGIAHSLIAARSFSDWVPTPKSQKLVASLHGYVPDLAWSVCNAFV